MAQYQAVFETPDGQVVLDQRREDLGYELTLSSPHDGRKFESAVAFADTVNGAVKSVADSFLGAVSRLSAKPEELSVEFEMRIDPEIGAVISSEGDGAHFRVKLLWASQQANGTPETPVEG